MDSLRLESSWWFVVGALALLELMVLAILIYLAKLRRRTHGRGPDLGSVQIVSRFDPRCISHEIERLRLGEKLNESLIKQMSAEDRALFEVSVIDALNKCSREDQHRLRSALIKYGYDEQSARRLMNEDLSNRVRASALLSLLRPQSRDPSIESEQRPTDEETALARATGRTTGPLDLD